MVGRPKSDRNAKTVSLTVSPEAWELFRRRAQKLGMTRSELVELIAKNQIPLLSTLERELLGESAAN